MQYYSNIFSAYRLQKVTTERDVVLLSATESKRVIVDKESPGRNLHG